MFNMAPGFAALLEGPDLRFVMANRAYLDLVGGRDVVGKTVAEALPEVANQGFVELLEKVRDSRVNPTSAERSQFGCIEMAPRTRRASSTSSTNR